MTKHRKRTKTDKPAADQQRESSTSVLKWVVVVLGVLAVGAFAYFRTSAVHTVSAPPGAPNVLIMLIDTLRADHMGCYGYQRNTSPNMDRIAAGGIRMERAYATAPWTPPSITTIFSSLYPDTHHVQKHSVFYGTTGIKDLQGDVVVDGIHTLAESFSSNGYQTAAFVCNPWITKKEGFDQGFQLFDEELSKVQPVPPAAAINRKALVFFDKQRDPDRPYMVYLHYMDVHGPYNAPDQFRKPFVDEVRATPRTVSMPPEERGRPGKLKNIEGRTVRKDPLLVDRPEYWTALYDAGVAHFDAQFSQLYQALQQRGALENTILVIVSDHGEELYDHGGWDHGFNLFDHQLYVPLIFSAPGILAEGKAVRQIVGLVDLMPTVLDLCSLAAPEGMQGRSFADVLRGAPESAETTAFAEGVKRNQFTKAWYENNYKLLYHTKSGRATLYDLQLDPGEKAPLDSTANATLIAEMTAKINAQVASNAKKGARYPAETSAISDEQRKRLEALGYLR